MTPLAYQITRQLTLPKSRRSGVDRTGLMKAMSDVKCFDVTEVHGAAISLLTGQEVKDQSSDETMVLDVGRLLDLKTLFLPAESTWIERKPRKGSRVGMLLIGDGAGRQAHCRFAFGGSEGFVSVFSATLDLDSPDFWAESYAHDLQPSRAQCEILSGEVALLPSFLALINTPRVVGRHTHQPNRTLERKLLKAGFSAGKFPLHSWTEIKLSITPPDVKPEEVQEAHFTGRKAYHFVRAHLRICNGQVGLVSPHWRGDPALGIKQSRYQVVP